MRTLAVAGLAALVVALPASAGRLPILASSDWWPVVSPSGTQVAYTTVNGQGRAFTLRVVNVANRRTTTVGSSSSQLDPTWSPSGAQLAYASGGLLYVANANGTAKHRYAAPTKSFAPAWRPGSTELAFLTTHGATNTDLWVGGALWAKNAIGRPAWSPDGTKLAFQRDDGIYVATGPGAETRVSTVASPGPPAWSPNGQQLAYTAGTSLYVAPVNQRSAIRRIATGLRNPGPPAWLPDGTAVSISHAGGAWVAQLGGPGYALDKTARTFGVGTAWIGPNAVVAASVPGCPGHVGLIEVKPLGALRQLTGTCVIAGTAGNDVIDGTSLWGDVIVAGAGNDTIHANDGHTDRINCGPGHDVVWADSVDKLSGCEVIHR